MLWGVCGGVLKFEAPWKEGAGEASKLQRFSSLCTVGDVFFPFLFFFVQSHVVGQAGRNKEMAGKIHHMLALNFPSFPLQAIIYTLPIPRSASPT